MQSGIRSNSTLARIRNLYKSFGYSWESLPGGVFFIFLCKIVLLFSNENPRRAEGINIRSRRARWNAFRVMWIYLAHPSGDESSEKCHLGRHLGGDWTRSYPSGPVAFCFSSSHDSWRLPIGVSGDIKSNENTVFSPTFLPVLLIVDAH